MNIPKLNTIKIYNLQNSYIKNKQKRLSAAGTIAFQGDIRSVHEAYCPQGVNSGAQTARKIWQQIEQSGNIFIFTHKFPDSDAINSGLMLVSAIGQRFPDKKVTFYVPGGYPSFLNETPGIEKVKTTVPKENIDLAITVDCAAQNVNDKGLYKNALKHIRIDHHTSALENQDVLLLNPKAASTTTMLYQQLFKPLGIVVTPEIAENILTGIITDTGTYKYSRNGDLSIATTEELLNKYPTALNVSVDSIKHKFDRNNAVSDELNNLIKDLFDEKHVKLITTKQGKKINIVLLTQRKLRKFKVKDSLPDIKSALSCNINSINKPADVNMLFWELGKEYGTKVELRSKEVDLCEFVNAFNGGGHAHSAGFMVKEPMSKVFRKVISAIKQYKF